MTYFANGTDGEIFQAKYCRRCVNWTEDEIGEHCPIMDLHELWNYEAAGKDGDETKRMALDFFILGDGINTERTCVMFQEGKTTQEPRTTAELSDSASVLAHPWMAARKRQDK